MLCLHENPIITYPHKNEYCDRKSNLFRQYSHRNKFLVIDYITKQNQLYLITRTFSVKQLET